MATINFDLTETQIADVLAQVDLSLRCIDNYLRLDLSEDDKLTLREDRIVYEDWRETYLEMQSRVAHAHALGAEFPRFAVTAAMRATLDREQAETDFGATLFFVPALAVSADVLFSPAQDE